MPTTPDNKYADLEKQIDDILSDGKLYLLPPGFWMFLLVNLLLMIGVAVLVIVAQNVLFAGQMERAMIFSVVSGIALALVIVTPPFFVLRGFRRALTYLRILIILLSVLILLFGVADIVTGGNLGLYAVIGFIVMVSAYLAVKSNTYQLLSIFTARRRELALQDVERRKQVLSKL